MTSQGPSEVAKSLPFAGPSPTVISCALDVARAPVVDQREAGDLAVGADHRRDLELEVEHCVAPGRRTGSPGPWIDAGLEK